MLAPPDAPHADPENVALRDTLAVPSGESAEEPVAGTKRGRFVLLRKLGEGGMGEVFVAYDEQLDRRVAIKLLRPDYVSDEARFRLLREAQALAKIAHPNVVTVFEAGQIGTDVFLAMEFVDGTTLHDWQQEKGRTLDEMLQAYIAAGRGLAAVHAAGLVHRDFKPTNVMIGRDERVRILDFGLAHAHAQRREKIEDIAKHLVTLESKLTMTGALVGTPAYMSPEQYLGEAVDARSDQFSFCVAMYEAVYGQHPFGAANLHELLSNMLQGKPLPPPPNNQVPKRVSNALERGLARQPTDRFPDMSALLDQLIEDPALDLTEHRTQRLLFGIPMALIALGQATVSLVFRRPALPTKTNLVRIVAIALVAVLGGSFIFRKTLLKNPFHRVMAFMLILSMSLVLMSRILGLVQDEMIPTILQRDFMILIGIGTTVAFMLSSFSRWLWLNPFIPLCGALGLTLFPTHTRLVAVGCFNTLVWIYLFTWNEVARAGRTMAGGNSGMHGTTSTISTLSRKRRP